jgi:hypothetical protein
MPVSLKAQAFRPVRPQNPGGGLEGEGSGRGVGSTASRTALHLGTELSSGARPASGAALSKLDASDLARAFSSSASA